jgi:DUF1009 family protein
MREGRADAGATRHEEAEPLGILTCAGSLPLEIAAAVAAQGRGVHLVAIDGFAGPEVAAYSHERVGLGQLNRMIRSFRRAGCLEIVIAGAMQRPDLMRLRPDLGLLRHLPTILSLTRGGDDSVLRRIVRFFEAQGFVVRGAGDVAPGLLAPAGAVGSRQPTTADQAAIARAARAVAVLGAFDVGQAAVATVDRAIAIEGARGTDALLTQLTERRSVAPATELPGVLVKLAKPGQEMRVDLPAIGPRTIERAAAAGLAGIAVGAGQSIVLERAQTVAAADAAGLFVVGLTEAESVPADVQPRLNARAAPYGPLTVLARRAPTPSERRDITIARRLREVLARERLGSAAVVAGEHVLAVSAALPVVAMLSALGRDRQWGRRRFRSRIGTLMLDLGASEGANTAAESPVGRILDREVFQAAAAAMLAGVVCLGGAIPEDRRDEVIGWANDARMYLMAEGGADV